VEIGRVPVVPKSNGTTSIHRSEPPTVATREGRFTSTPAVREASSTSFDMIGFRVVDHDGWEFLAGQEPSFPI
jgi:hypothetical protein